MRYLTLGEVVTLHRRVIAHSGGSSGIRDLGLLESALAQPKATFDATDLHPTVIERRQPWGLLWWRTMPSSMETSASAMRRWKSF